MTCIIDSTMLSEVTMCIIIFFLNNTFSFFTDIKILEIHSLRVFLLPRLYSFNLLTKALH